jgi:hypothetical protein
VETGFCEKIMLKQRDEIVPRFDRITISPRHFTAGFPASRRQGRSAARNVDPAATAPLQPRAVGAIMYFT